VLQIIESQEPLRPLPRRFSIGVLGDVRLEVRGTLPGMRFRDVVSDLLVFSPLTSVVAGTAVNMARATRQVFQRAHVIAKVGSDEHLPFIEAGLDALGVEYSLIQDPRITNGLTIVLRDTVPHGPGVRLLLSGRPSPNLALNVDDLSDVRRLVTDLDVLFIDGYSLLADPSRTAALGLANLASSSGVATCLDVVPHMIDRELAPEILFQAMREFDYVACEARTAARLLTSDPGDVFKESQLPRLLEQLAALNQDIVWLLRYGIGDMEDVVMCAPGQPVLHYTTGYALATDTVGFGDKVLSHELRYLLESRRGQKAQEIPNP
jgi:sugar/nucleoside kinase (ribokinase family)